LQKEVYVRTPAWWEEGGGYYTPAYFNQNQSKCFDPVFVQWQNEALTGILRPVRKSAILDVGCGLGQVSAEFARRGHNMTGFDLNGPFLIRAKKDAERERLSIRFVKGDMRTLPFPDESFDHVLCVGPAFGIFPSLEDDRKTLQEMARVVRPGGRVLIEQWAKERSDDRNAPLEWTEPNQDGTKIAFRAWGKRGRAYVSINDPRAAVPVTIDYKIYTVQEISECFSLLGLSSIRATYWTWWMNAETTEEGTGDMEARRLIVTAEKPRR